MQWSKQQEKAIKATKAWLEDDSAAQVFRLFGYAGTGKTTLAKELAGHAKGKVVYACFTGKAALVLQRKGCPGASTIHSLIYKAVRDDRTGEVKFELDHDSEAAQAGLVIVDEVSMVGEQLAMDLLSFGTKVLVLGDPAQLPPVKGEGFFINSKPDVMLHDIHRQAADNPIIRMSMDIREGRGLQPGEYGDSIVIPRGDLDKSAMREIAVGADQILCGLNKTRQQYNERMRSIYDYQGDTPAEGERLVCLRNNHTKGLLNGSLWEVKSDFGTDDRLTHLEVKNIDQENGALVMAEVPIEFWKGREKSLDWRELRKMDQFTYGYALTVHKSQGSQWDNVLLFDESRVFREDAAKHLYTGVTRAAEKITVVI